jgi:hypothetical protein
MFQALLCPSLGARDYKERWSGVGMRDVARATSLIPDAQPATPHQTNGQPT